MMSKEVHWLLEEKYEGKKNPQYDLDVKRLESGEPLGYVIGHVQFLGCRIYLDSKPLIPRFETEYWVEKVIESIKTHSNTSLRVLDLCAGSGCIGVAVAEAIPDLHVTFAEIDESHLSTIQKNIEYNLSDRGQHLDVIESDLFTNLTGKFDYILSNPPYIDKALDRTEPCVKNYEPHLALYGGDQGLGVISDIIKKAPGYLNQSGQLWLEHEPEQLEAISFLAKQNGFTANHHKDQYGVERYSVLSEKTKDVS